MQASLPQHDHAKQQVAHNEAEQVVVGFVDKLLVDSPVAVKRADNRSARFAGNPVAVNTVAKFADSSPADNLPEQFADSQIAQVAPIDNQPADR